MMKIRRDISVGAIIHIYMEISQGNYLHSYIYLKQAKMSCFSFYLFSFLLLQNQRTGGQNKSCPRGRTGISRSGAVRGRRVGGEYGAKNFVHMYVNAKMIPVEAISEIRGGRIKENGRGGEFMYDIFDTL
jgi:hypothetical protein